MKHRFLYIMALLLTLATGAWAQDPDPIDLTPSADGTVWKLSTMPEYDVELEVTYYTDEEIAAMEEAAYTEGVELTKNPDGSWTLAATPAFDVELEVEYETALALSETTDNSAALTEWDGYEADVTLTRTLQTGGWNTFAVPFSIDTPEDWTVKELTETAYDDVTKELTLTFGDAQSIEAGKPYLVKVASESNVDLSTAPFSGVIIVDGTTETETTYAKFVPVMNPTSLTAQDKSVLFVSGGNTLTYPSGDGSIKGFRAYFKLTDEMAIKAFNMDFGDEEVTGIKPLSDSPSKGENIYNVAGQRLERTQRGINIVSGKKVIIK